MIAMGRLKPGISMQHARTELDAITLRLEGEYPGTNRGQRAGVESLQALLTSGLRPALNLLLGAVIFVLLLVSANVANLMLAKALGRAREISIRASLGASRTRVVAQLLTEGVLMAGFGCVAGIGLAAVGLRLLVARIAPDLPPGVEVHMDGTVLAFTAALAFIVGLVSALVPAIRVCRSEWGEALRQRDRTSGTRGHNRIRGALVAAQIAIAMVLIGGAGLLLQSFLKLQGVNPGYRAEGLLTMEYRLPKAKYSNGDLLTAAHLRIVEAVRSTPGVRGAALIRALPFSGNGNVVSFSPADKPEPPAAQLPHARYNAVDTDAFRVMEIPLLRGREFTVDDRKESARVVVVNESFANRFWPGQDAAGRQVRIPAHDMETGPSIATIIGVVGDIKHDNLDDPEMSQMYVPMTQDPFVFSTLIVRADGDPMAMVRTVQKAVWSVDKDQPVWKIRTLDTLIDNSLSGRKLIAGIIGGFWIAAMLLAAIGLYGVVAYSVAQRTTELGVRMALGATSGRLVKLVLGESLRMVVVGAVLGAVLAGFSARLLESQLYGVKAADPLTYGTVIALLFATAIAASAVPAWRATRIDPSAALRSE